MVNKITTLQLKASPETKVYPNVRDENIPSSIARQTDVKKASDKLQTRMNEICSGFNSRIADIADETTQNTSDISTNTNAISSNTNAISSNSSDISALKAKVNGFADAVATKSITADSATIDALHSSTFELGEYTDGSIEKHYLWDDSSYAYGQRFKSIYFGNRDDAENKKSYLLYERGEGGISDLIRLGASDSSSSAYLTLFPTAATLSIGRFDFLFRPNSMNAFSVQATTGTGYTGTINFPKMPIGGIVTIATTNYVDNKISAMQTKIYHHHLSFKASQSSDSSCFFEVDGYSSKDLNIDSIQDLCSVFGNTRFSAVGWYGRVNAIILELRVGTTLSTTQLAYLASTKLFESFSVTASYSLTITDSVTAL